jgi:hypothetical protein
MFAYG